MGPALGISSRQGADAGQVADARQCAGALEKASVSGDVRTIQLDGQGEEGGVVKREGEFASQAGGALQ